MKKIIYALMFIIVAVVLSIVRYGYHESINDHDIIDLKGLHQAHPDYYKNDWFVETVPQPHIVNDHFVEWSEAAGMLSEAKMFHWGLSAAILAYACFLFGGWAGNYGYGLALITLLSLGPTSPLGSGTALLGWQLPHSLGGALLLLGFMSLILECRWLVLACLFLTPIAHVQHGLHLGLLAFAWCGFTTLLGKKRWNLMLASAVAMGLSLWLAKLGDVAGGQATFSEACKTYTPFHCLSSSWPAFWWLTAIFILIAQLPFIGSLYRSPRPAFRAMAYTLVSINICYWICMGLEYFRIEPFETFVRNTNFYRWITLLIFSAGAGLILLLKENTYKWPRAILFLILTFGFFGRSFSAVAEESDLKFYLIATVIASAVVLAAVKIKNSFWRISLVNVTLIAVLVLFARPMDSREPLIRMGKQIEAVVPVGETIIASPLIVMLRAVSHRAVIVDRKGIPYGEPYLSQWRERIADMGNGDDASYAQIPYDKWLAIAKKYKAHYAFVIATDGRIAELNKNHQLIYANDQLRVAVYKLNY